MIESYNKHIKRHFKAKEQFPSELSKEKFLNRIHRRFGKVKSFWFNDAYEESNFFQLTSL